MEGGHLDKGTEIGYMDNDPVKNGGHMVLQPFFKESVFLDFDQIAFGLCGIEFGFRRGKGDRAEFGAGGLPGIIAGESECQLPVCDEVGIAAQGRITEVTETFENNAVTVEAVLGEGALNIMQKIKRREKVRK